MASQLFYFGTEEQMAWVPAPKTGMTANSVKWRASGLLLNGGAFARSSTASHLEYNMAWPVMSREESYSLIDYFNGVYGEGPFYFIDPMAAAYNVLPNWMAAPRLQTVDAPSMVSGVTPNPGGWVPTNYFYPGPTAIYSLAAAQVGKQFIFPVPPGYTFRFGWHGTATGTARVQVSGATTLAISPISSTGSFIRVSDSVVRDATGFVGVQLIGGASGGTLTLRGMTAVILPTSTPDPSGNFVSGRGNSGVLLRDDPQVTAYSAVLNNTAVGVAANFIETGAWT